MANGTSALPDWLREIDTMSPQARKATMKAMRAYMKAMDYDDDDAGDDDDDDDDMEKKKKAKKAAKSFAVDDSVVSDLRKSIETLTDEVSDLRKSEYDWDWDDAAEYFDTDELNEAEALDATGLIKSFTGASVQGFRQVQGMIATQQKQIELQGKLIKSMAEANLKLLEGFNKQANADAEIRKSIAELAGSPAVQRGVTDPRQMAVMARMFAKSAASGSAAATQANPFAGALPAPAQDGQGGQQVVSMVALTHETRGLAKSLRDSLMKKGMEAHDAGDGEGFQAAQAAMVQLERAVNRGQIFLHPDHQRRFDLSLVPSN